jgi:hypothetical protein
MVTAVGAYLDRLAELGGGDISVEAELDLGEFIPDGFGTADHIHISGSRLTVTDLKYGKGVRVDAEHNPQLKLYGVGALAAFDHLYDIETVVLRIDQPRIDHVSEWEISADELWTWGTDVVAPAAKLATGQNAPRVPGKVQCKWCLAKATCPELQKAAAGTSAYRPVTELEAKELGEALELVDLVTDWAKAVEARAFELMTGGLEVPGYKLVHGRARRDWADTKAAEAKLRRLLKVDGAMPRKLISPAQAQKALGKNWDKVADLVAVQSGKPTIASADDKRQAISPAESLGFADLNDSE